MSIVAALLVLPVNAALGQAAHTRDRMEATCLKMNLVLTALAGLAVAIFLLAARAPLPEALLLGAYGATLTCRWFVRCFAFVKGQTATAIISDLVYAGVLVAGLGALLFTRHVAFLPAALLLLGAAIAGLLPFGRTFLRDQVRAISRARLSDYSAIFRDLTRWSLLGVVLTELTVNAHAYLVTFISGAGPFALLAVGQILMRPASLVQSALPDLERPRMTRAIAAKDRATLTRVSRDFHIALILVWLATAVLAAAILDFAPSLLLKKGYALHDVVLVTLITSLIMLVRSFRTPPATFMQAAGEFKALVGIGVYTSVISVALTLGFLFALGPIASMLGILTGEIIILVQLNRMTARWVERHG